LIYLPITTYLDARIAEINNSISGTANDWLKFSLTGEKPENGKLNSYRLMIEQDDVDETNESRPFNVTANVELSFLIPNGDLTKYQDLLDSYIHTLVKHIRNNSAYSYSSAWRLNVMKVGAGDLDNIVDGVLSCTLTMELQIIDGTTINTNPPSAPTLTSPADGATSGTVDQSFNWTGTAETWHIIIYLDGVEVISQEGLTVSSFTVPADSSLTDGSTYTWKVRGKNAGGYGAFSSIRTFTVNDNPLPEVPTYVGPSNGANSTSRLVEFNWNVSARADTYEIQIASDSGFTSILTTVTGLTVTTYEYTFSADATYYWKVRATNSFGSSSYTTARSVVVAFAYEPETLAYQTRVLADSGEIISLDAVNNAILHAKTNGYWNNVRSWVDPQFGVKKSGSAISKLYCLAGFDIIGTNTPTYNATGLNSLPSFDFNGTSNYMTVPNMGLGLGTISAEVFAVGQRDADPPTDPTSGFWFYGSQAGVDNHVPYADGNIYDGWGTSVRKTVGNPASSMASKFLYNISTASGAWTVRLNGTQIYTTASNTVGWRTSPLLGKSDGSFFYKGKFGSILILNIVTTTQRTLINAYFNTKYAIY